MADVVVCEPAAGCKDPHPHRWHCMRGHQLANDIPATRGVCPLPVCIRRGANPTPTEETP